MVVYYDGIRAVFQDSRVAEMLKMKPGKDKTELKFIHW